MRTKLVAGIHKQTETTIVNARDALIGKSNDFEAASDLIRDELAAMVLLGKGTSESK
jgi:translation elongation factor EF-Ts